MALPPKVYALSPSFYAPPSPQSLSPITAQLNFLCPPPRKKSDNPRSLSLPKATAPRGSSFHFLLSSPSFPVAFGLYIPLCSNRTVPPCILSTFPASCSSADFPFQPAPLGTDGVPSHNKLFVSVTTIPSLSLLIPLGI